MTVGSETCTSVSVLSDSLIECIVPPGFGAQLKVTLTAVVPVLYGVPYSPGLRFNMHLPTLKKSGFSYDGGSGKFCA